ncbi:steroid delta-isomerase [Nocardioides marmoriginsengisoli]|uniref:Steroid delta-isomerase n=1 Tax=Nocardioides marmoriginsengisoli TaxID=661483 RepID=A0A3N0CGV5_9ACTN|nr:nuclear transport factor 2 family protein [Nocardioides marmoriginsengisoli]RNL62549.1 steroid delta-isomerase [Nocardioides marmoriginsengisoli]
MPITNEQAEANVRRYLELVATGTAAEIVALYAPDGVLEDPVGSEPLVGREAIQGFYATLEPMKVTTELLAIRASGGEAAFHFHIETDTGAGVAVLDPMEMMAFDEDGLIRSMRAWWNDGDMTFG